jgi:chromosomal replication initiator protein
MNMMIDQQLAVASSFARVQGRLRSSVGEDVYSSWFARMDLESVGDQSAHLSVPTRFLKSWIQAHYADRVLTSFQAEMPEVNRIDLTVRTCMRATAPTKEAAPAPVAKTGSDAIPPELRAVATRPVSTSHDALGGSPLDPRLTFGSFVIGRSNTLANAAARRVAECRSDDIVMFNPLYIHASVGLGKTHLLQAIAWAGNNGSERKVLYLTAEKFAYGLMAAIEARGVLAFKEALRSVDVLIIDDLQFLQGKSTQTEFCHTLNALIDAGRQVVIAADRPPSDLDGLDDRIRSRLACGLVVEIGKLGEDLRLDILKSRVAAAQAHHAGFDIPAPVLDYLARVIVHNGRDLEGAVNRLLAHSKLRGALVTLDMAEKMLHDLIRPQEPRRIKIEDIQRVVARQYNVGRSDMLSARRTANVVRPRQVAMYLAKILTLRSLPEIGRRFGGRDHTTVLHAVRKIEALVARDAQLAEEVESLKKQLQE